MEKLKPKLFSVMKTYTKEQFVKDVVAGIIVAIIALPLSIALAIASPVFFNIFATNISAVFPDFISGKIGFGIFVYIGSLALLLAINIIIAVKGVTVKYKQCYVGGIPAEEYFELVEKGTDKAVIRQMMAEALEKKAAGSEEKKEEVKEEANA